MAVVIFRSLIFSCLFLSCWQRSWSFHFHFSLDIFSDISGNSVRYSGHAPFLEEERKQVVNVTQQLQTLFVENPKAQTVFYELLKELKKS